MSTNDLEKLTKLWRNDGSAGQDCSPYTCPPSTICAPDHGPPCSPYSCTPSRNHEELEEPVGPSRQP